MRCKLCLKVIGHPSQASKELQICGSCNKQFKHIEHPDIPTIKRVNVNGKRHYQTPYGLYKAITGFLHLLPLPTGLVEWRNKVGDDVADYVMNAGAIRGTKLHNIVESYLLNKTMQNLNRRFGVTAVGLFKLMKPALDKINNIKCIEQSLFSQELKLAGTTDCIAEYDGVPSVIDFKSASRMKEKDDISNYFMQATFYSIAWEECTGQKIEQIVVIMTAEDGRMQVFKEQRSNYIEELKKAIIDFGGLI